MRWFWELQDKNGLLTPPTPLCQGGPRKRPLREGVGFSGGPGQGLCVRGERRLREDHRLGEEPKTIISRRAAENAEEEKPGQRFVFL